MIRSAIGVFTLGVCMDDEVRVAVEIDAGEMSMMVVVSCVLAVEWSLVVEMGMSVEDN